MPPSELSHCKGSGFVGVTHDSVDVLMDQYANLFGAGLGLQILQQLGGINTVMVRPVSCLNCAAWVLVTFPKQGRCAMFAM